jgi:hypothetical protein
MFQNNKTQFNEKYKVDQLTEDLGQTKLETVLQPAEIIDDSAKGDYSYN